MKYTKAQIKEALKTSRAKWVITKRGEEVLRAKEKCGFCEMVGNNFDITGGKDNGACKECMGVFWDGRSCLQPIAFIDDCMTLDSDDSGWEAACTEMQSEFDRIEKEFCEPEVYEVECVWKHKNDLTYPDKDHNEFLWRDFIGKRTKLTIEVLD